MTGLLLLSLVCLAVYAAVSLVSSRQQAFARAEEARQFAAAERRRIEECGEVVLYFANHLGYIARSCISRSELADLIDSGISPDDLADRIARRISEVDGLVLGYQQLGSTQVDVRLTAEHVARHQYVIGKSGSGKTNLLRNLILQDIESGQGVGVIAPEAEMLYEEILPYIPDHRVSDVILCDPSDPECPVSFNPLHLDPGEDLDTKVDECLTIFNRIIDSPGPRASEILRQILYVLIARRGSTLLDVERLFWRASGRIRRTFHPARCRTTA